MQLDIRREATGTPAKRHICQIEVVGRPFVGSTGEAATSDANA